MKPLIRFLMLSYFLLMMGFFVVMFTSFIHHPLTILGFSFAIIFIESLLHIIYKKEVENDIIEEKQEPRNE